MYIFMNFIHPLKFPAVWKDEAATVSDIKPAEENRPDKKWVTTTKIHQGLIAPISHNYLNNSYFSLFSSSEKALLVTNGVLSWNWVPCPQVNNIYQSWPEAKCRSAQKPDVCQCVCVCVWRLYIVADWCVYTWSQHLLLFFKQAIFPNQHEQPAHQLFHVTFNHAALPGEANQNHRSGGRFSRSSFSVSMLRN